MFNRNLTCIPEPLSPLPRRRPQLPAPLRILQNPADRGRQRERIKRLRQRAGDEVINDVA